MLSGALHFVCEIEGGLARPHHLHFCREDTGSMYSSKSVEPIGSPSTRSGQALQLRGCFALRSGLCSG